MYSPSLSHCLQQTQPRSNLWACTCRIVNHYAGTQHPCTDFTVLMAALVFSSLAASVNSNAWSGASSGPGSERRQLRMSALELEGFLTEMLADQGFAWETFETPVAPSLHVVVGTTSSNSNAPADLDGHSEQYIIRGVTHQNLSLPAHRHLLDVFCQRDWICPVSPGRTIRRHAAAPQRPRIQGELAAYTTGPAAGSPTARVRVCSHSWSDWGRASRSTGPTRPTTSCWTSGSALVGVNYILLKVLSLGLRIIPEVRGFGEEYEDVGVCGSLQQIAHDELKL
ncbi:hypothetical protein B0T14DRAFT_569339 [Immersiella caudata]|uniref:Uncharacterized protein n=1 Tax=Immersiella caudata TaxID=314043 RepID=A0AA39WD95_9PEZI|nr:hypothetical protein B0T14DRAFT_569339 [Immersiella caudata]